MKDSKRFLHDEKIKKEYDTSKYNEKFVRDTLEAEKRGALNPMDDAYFERLRNGG